MTTAIPVDETIGELVRQTVLLRSIQDMWDERGEHLSAQRAMESADDYQVALTRRMTHIESVWEQVGPYTVRLMWIDPFADHLNGYWFALIKENG